jgi:hypothetical protein|tara:strand:- start:116 stop:538 length:423 start_codon:yes stop_codon:yes gene_type:complete
MDYKLTRGSSKGDYLKFIIKHLLTFPLIYLPLIPIIILDISTEIYHQIGFRLCGIPLVKRSKHIKIDRHRLKYLSWFDKLNCTYCGYANGLLRYVSEIGAETERYWCKIKHKKNKNFAEPSHHKEFLKFGDKSSYVKKYK